MDEKKVREAICKLKVRINAKREKIKHNKVFFPNQDNSQLEEDIDIYETAIEALEKQLPKKVDVWANETQHCPVCDKDLTHTGLHICPECYQRLCYTK